MFKLLASNIAGILLSHFPDYPGNERLWTGSYICGYPGYDMRYKKKSHLIGHFFSHTGTSKFKCPHPDCVGNEYFRDNAMLKRHIAAKHTLDKPFQCGMCDKRFSRKDHLKLHRKHMHGIE